MSRFLLLLLLLSPVEANQPSIDSMHAAYISAGWVPVMHPGAPSGLFVCVDSKVSPHVDRVVNMIVDRAKGVRCA